MEGALASVATGALQTVVKKLTSLLGEECERLKRSRSEIKWLSSELEAMNSFLVKMSKLEDPDDEQDKLWMKDVRELSYDIEDSLDKFFMQHGAKPDGFMKKIRSLLDRTKSRHRIAKEIQDLKTKVKEVDERNKRYRDGDHPSPAVQRSTVDPRALVIFKDARKLVGIDGPKSEITRLLELEEEHIGQHGSSAKMQPKIVSIVGNGGLGKTTLAHQVYQQLTNQADFGENKEFNCGAFLSVSRNPNIETVLRRILYEVVRSEDDQGQKNPNNKFMFEGDYISKVAGTEQLITMIREHLENKRYFIVLDDIWEAETWETIQNIFPVTHNGSKIIITTRINKVALECCRSTNGYIYNIRPLNMAQSKELFYGRLFNPEEKCPSDLEEIACKILEKCAGLPLAIIAISGLLSSKKKTRKEWDLVKNSIGRALERDSNVEEMLKILSLSYFDLRPHLRTCLLYLSIFPEDYNIEKDSLIRRWIGEGFIHDQNQLGAYNSGERCFDDLINRGLIQPGERDEFDEVKSCRVHDTVLDFIVSKAIDENFLTLVGVPGVNHVAGNKVRRLSMQNDGEIPSGLVLSSVRSLNVFGSNVKIPSLSEFSLLRVLAFEDCGQLQDENLADVGDLLQLRYLRLNKASAVTELPEETAELQHLGTLDVHLVTTLTKNEDGDSIMKVIMEIPATICQVERLECLVTLVASENTILPDEITDMKALRVLEGVNVWFQSLDIVKGLGELSNLRKLGIQLIPFETEDFCEDLSDSDSFDFEEKDFYLSKKEKDFSELCEEMASSIRKLSKSCLDSLHIRTLLKPPEILNMLCQEDDDIPVLQELVFDGHTISGIAAWSDLLVNLQKFRFCCYYYTLSEKDVETLGSISGLEYLYIGLYLGYDNDLKAPLERAMNAHPNRPKFEWVRALTVQDSIIEYLEDSGLGV